MYNLAEQLHRSTLAVNFVRGLYTGPSCESQQSPIRKTTYEKSFRLDGVYRSATPFQARSSGFMQLDCGAGSWRRRLTLTQSETTWSSAASLSQCSANDPILRHLRRGHMRQKGRLQFLPRLGSEIQNSRVRPQLRAPGSGSIPPSAASGQKCTCESRHACMG